MLGKLGDAFQKLMQQDDRSAEEKLRDQLRAERKVKKHNKTIEIECYFTEINKLKAQRSKLINKGKGDQPQAKQMTEHISEGIRDLQQEIEELADLFKLLGEATTQADSFSSRCAKLKLQEDIDGFEGGGNVSINITRDKSSELQDLKDL